MTANEEGLELEYHLVDTDEAVLGPLLHAAYAVVDAVVRGDNFRDWLVEKMTLTNGSESVQLASGMRDWDRSVVEISHDKEMGHVAIRHTFIKAEARQPAVYEAYIAEEGLIVGGMRHDTAVRGGSQPSDRRHSSSYTAEEWLAGLDQIADACDTAAKARAGSPVMRMLGRLIVAPPRP